MAGTVIKLTLYDPATSEVRREFTRLFVPWKLLKAAVRMSKTLAPEQMTEADVDSLAALVIETFGNQFTLDELNEGADISEMVTVLNQIVAKAKGTESNALRPNPT